MARCQGSPGVCVKMAGCGHFFGAQNDVLYCVSVENGKGWGELKLGLNLNSRRPG
jgi:hypothetical protein